MRNTFSIEVSEISNNPLITVFVSNGSVRIEGAGDDPIPYALLFDSTNEGVLIKEIAAIPVNGAQEVTFSEQDRIPQAMASHPGLLGVPEFGGPKPSWQPKVYQTMVQALVDQGLYQREADSMVRTWWRSYFEHRGCRIFWIVPDAFVEKVLPLDVTPAHSLQARARGTQ
jgi:hypothetical protein